MSVSIAAESNVTFVLTYEELLQRKFGQYEILIRVKPKSLVQQFQVNHQMVNLTFSFDDLMILWTNNVLVLFLGGNRFWPTSMNLRACLM